MKLFHIVGFSCWILFSNFIINLHLSTLQTILILLAGGVISYFIRIVGDRLIEKLRRK